MSKAQKAYKDNLTKRTYTVSKANALVRSRYTLSAQGLKLLNYLVSRIKPGEDLSTEKVFDIKEYCEICGLDSKGGANYRYIRETIKSIADKSVFIPTEDGGETLIRWLSTVDIHPDTGEVKYKFFEKIIPLIQQLQEQFTRFELGYTLAMKSQYSIRLYELFKSYESLASYKVPLEELRKNLGAENYARYPDFKRKVLDKGIEEINHFTDIVVIYEAEHKGKKVVSLIFSIQKKEMKDLVFTWKETESTLYGSKFKDAGADTIQEYSKIQYGES